jgi:hypothetical protein
VYLSPRAPALQSDEGGDDAMKKLAIKVSRKQTRSLLLTNHG